MPATMHAPATEPGARPPEPGPGGHLAAPTARRARADRASGLALVVLMAAAFGAVLRTVVQVAGGPPPTGPGQVAPAFAARTPAGAPVALADHAGQVVLLDFWATWCPPCVASMPALERLHRAYAARGFTVLGVNQEAGAEGQVQRFLAARGLSFPVAMDDGGVAATYGVFTFPTSFLVGRDGVVRGVHRGVAREDGLRAEIEALLAEPAPPSRGGAPGRSE